MNVYALGDLHLSLAVPKPMNIFGDNWTDHDKLIEHNWTSIVKDDDLVLIPGDISWAMHIEQAKRDIDFIDSLPGKKVMIKGNHDYWWGSISKVRSILGQDFFALQNDNVRFGNLIVCGTRGWVCPGSVYFKAEDDQKIYDREVLRLKLSLSNVKKQQNDKLIVMVHYPPFNEKRTHLELTEIFDQYKVDKVVYGHLHSKSCQSAFEGNIGGVEYTLTSSDHLNFSPKLIMTGID